MKPKICGYRATVKVPEDICKQGYPFHHGDMVFIFGEIEGMPEHCVFADMHGKTYFGYHTGNFTPLD